MQSEPSSRAECTCGCTVAQHMGKPTGCPRHGLHEFEPAVINDRCKCSHDRFWHNWGSENDGACSKPDCDCNTYDPVTVETVELPDSGDRLAAAMRGLWKASDRECADMVRKFAARHGVRQDDFSEPKPFEIPSIQTGCAVLHRDAGGNVAPCPDEIPVEAYAEAVSGAVARMRAEIGPLPPPEGPEYAPCVACGHIEPDHSAFGAPHCLKCDCVAYRTEPDFILPPQPERRPSLTVQYSVAGGHPYEVSIPGDASVTAEGGALIIKHPSAEVLAITRVAPMEG